MDSIDQVLLEAWNRISREIRQKRVRALERSRRRFMAALKHPIREMCLVIRASVTRILKPGGTFIASSCYHPSKTVVNGERLHPTAQPDEW